VTRFLTLAFLAAGCAAPAAADLIIVDRDVLACPLEEVRETRVLTTVVGGRVVYARDGRPEGGRSK
jgi:hypothetical protein